jgi:peptidoglycan/LPS O-acetylase OafA/YrhL
MWHQLFIIHFYDSVGIKLAREGFQPVIEYGAFYVWVLVIVFPLALASYRWIEMPGMRLGEYIIRMLDKKKDQSKNTEKKEEKQEEKLLVLQPIGEK